MEETIKTKIKDTMTQREENAKTVWEVVEDIFEGRVEDVPMTGSILCGKTADDVLREIKKRDRE